MLSRYCDVCIQNMLGTVILEMMELEKNFSTINDHSSCRIFFELFRHALSYSFL